MEVDVDKILEKLLDVRGSKPGKQVNLSENEIKGLIAKSRDIFINQPMLLELEAPIKVCGTAFLFSTIEQIRWHPWAILRFVATFWIWWIPPWIQLPFSWWLRRSWQTKSGDDLLAVGLQDQIPWKLLSFERQSWMLIDQQNLWLLWWMYFFFSLHNKNWMIFRQKKIQHQTMEGLYRLF